MFYTSPESDILKMVVEGTIAASGGAWDGFSNVGGEEDEEW